MMTLCYVEGLSQVLVFIEVIVIGKVSSTGRTCKANDDKREIDNCLIRMEFFYVS